jgi:thiol-disulfide isomerase/thioredoxin
MDGEGGPGRTAARSTLSRGAASWWAASAAAALALTACAPSAGLGGTTAGAPPAASSVPAAEPSGGGTAALNLRGSTLDGGSFDSSRLAGRPVVLWFWAPWCTICRAEAPDVAEVAAEYAGRVEVIGVAGRGDLASMRSFVADTGTGSLVHLVDEDGAVWNRFGVVSQPTFVFVDAAGTTESFAGSLAGGQLDAFVEDLL